jgi:hypothetical protein
MSGTEDRRAPGATRIPFDALVEVGGALGPSFEAQAVNVSEDGIQLRTAYLPEPGQPLTCRFDGGPGRNVLAAGEVVWARGEARGGEFGVRFTDVDAEGVDALKRLCGVAEGGDPSGAMAISAGSKVRLHIDGLASPMRAKIKDSRATEVTVGSELGFLQVGKSLELEDAQSGGKRPACIDRVDVAIDPTSHVPQLVVTLRYADAQAEIDAARGMAAPAAPAVNSKPSDDLRSMEEASAQMKSALARNLSRVAPAVQRLAARARTTVALLAKNRAEKAAAPRTTAPPPGGGLHTSGRRVIRGEAPSTPGDLAAAPRFTLTKRRAVVAGAIMTAAILGAVALKKAHPADEASAVAASPDPSAASASGVAESPAPPPASSQALAPAQAPAPAAESAPATTGALAAADEPVEEAPAPRKHFHVPPFGNGPVHHGNVLRLKLDGPIESMEGAQQPTGFEVKIPNRKSVEAAAPLAARDSRIAAIKVSNGSAGADLTVAFKDGVPNYQVSARGDTLVISLAPVGAIDKVASKDPKGEHADKGDKAEHSSKHKSHDKAGKKKTTEI